MRDVWKLALAIALGLTIFAGGTSLVHSHQRHVQQVRESERRDRGAALRRARALARKVAADAAAQRFADEMQAAERAQERIDARARRQGKIEVARTNAAERKLQQRANAENRHSELCSEGKATDC
jgi:hypothetical protein